MGRASYLHLTTAANVIHIIIFFISATLLTINLNSSVFTWPLHITAEVWLRFKVILPNTKLCGMISDAGRTQL